jgi:hypothetical protein
VFVVTCLHSLLEICREDPSPSAGPVAAGRRGYHPE